MTFAHEAVAALPSGANADAAAIRAMCERRYVYALDASEDSRNFVAVDPVSGVLPFYLKQNNVDFQYDATDSITTHDGVTCLVTSEGKRYKSGTIAPPYSVLSRSTSAQPVSPSAGDAYIVPTAATGTAWSGQDGKIAMYGPRGWQFAVSPIGREIYVRDVDAYYHRNDSGVWTAGVGTLTLGANSVPITAVIGAKASFIVKVENQTTNAPPGSPSVGAAYIIGSSPTGTWSGNAGKMAVCLSTGVFTIIAPDTGDQVYDKALNSNYRYTGSGWVPATGAIVDSSLVFTQGSGSQGGFGSANYSYSDSSAPATSNLGRADLASISWTAKRSGARLRFHYQARIVSVTVGVGVKAFSAGLFRDSLVNAVDWTGIPLSCVSAGTEAHHCLLEFNITAPDASSHTYNVSFFMIDSNNQITNLSRRSFEIEEFA